MGFTWILLNLKSKLRNYQIALIQLRFQKSLKKLKEKVPVSEKKSIAMNKVFFFVFFFIGYPHILLKDETSLVQDL